MPACLTPELVIDPALVRENYARLKAAAGTASVAAVVKADAYGIGMACVVPALIDAGCNCFWVARAVEGIALRALAPQATIYVLEGPDPSFITELHTHRLRPVINRPDQLALWVAAGYGPVALHLETGMHRLALQDDEIDQAVTAWRDGALKVALVMSHLAIADEPANPMNADQLTRFEKLKQLFPNVPASLAASFGVMLPDPAFRQDMIRAGRALHGVCHPVTREVFTRQTFRLSAPVVQIATVKAGDSVGYGASFKASSPRRIATLGIGYADGIPRTLQKQGEVFFTTNGKTYAAPLAGRVSMDLLSCDITDIPQALVNEGSRADLITPDHDGEAFAASIPDGFDYELFTHLSPRIKRRMGTL